MKALLSLLSMVLAFSLAMGPAAAQYPHKPLTLIVPFTAGGPSDSAARIFGQALSKAIGQPVVVDNRPGANGAIAARAVLGAPPDGYTFLWGVASMVAIPLLQHASPFHSLAEFTPVSIIGRFAFSMYQHPSVPAKSVDEFIRYARSNPDKLSYATSTLNEFMAAAQFMKAADIRMVRVPYKGGAQAMPDLLEGRVQVAFVPVQLGLPYLKDGRLRALATILPQRSAAAPDIPTMAEAGVRGVSVPTWQAILAPPGLPQEIVDRIASAARQIVRDPEVRAQFQQQAFQPEGSAPESLSAAIADELETWRVFIRENDVPQE